MKIIFSPIGSCHSKSPLLWTPKDPLRSTIFHSFVGTTVYLFVLDQSLESQCLQILLLARSTSHNLASWTSNISTQWSLVWAFLQYLWWRFLKAWGLNLFLKISSCYTCPQCSCYSWRFCPQLLWGRLENESFILVVSCY